MSPNREGLMPRALGSLDFHEVVKHYAAGLTRHVPPLGVLAKIPYLDLKLRLFKHLLMRVDKLTMAGRRNAGPQDSF